MEPQKRIALIPAYEPGIILLRLLDEAEAAGLELVVVDDGSGMDYEDTFHCAEQSAVVLTHPQNLGKGCALRTGMDYIQKHYTGSYTIVTLDADGQHKIEDALRVCEQAESRPEALILGSRKLTGRVPLRSRFGNAITRGVFRASTGVSVYDTQTGLRAFSSHLIPRMMDIPGDRYEYEMNVLLSFARSKTPILEVEIATVYISGNSGSHFNAVKDSYRIYKEILKFSGSSFISFLLDYGLYSLFSALAAGAGAAGLTLANVGARIISSGVNYTINRKLVFQSDKSIWRSAVEYFLLAAAILAGNTLLLQLLVGGLGMNRYGAKILTELVFFAISWTVQRLFIFRRREGAA